jgi:tRNA(Ile)-lysidine synthase
MRLLDSLTNFLHREAAIRPGDGIVVAFSGGADSTALLYGLARLAPRLAISVHAAHLDHGLDAGSPGRAAAAARIAARLGVDCVVERREVEADRPGGSGLEGEARRVRYAFLEAVRDRLGCRFIATAHHRDDQAETVLLRIVYGSSPLGLGSIERRRGAILRPLLDLDRSELRAALTAAGVDWLDDPTNDGARPRSQMRRWLGTEPRQLSTRLASIAGHASGARLAVDRALIEVLDARREFDGASASFPAMRRLPPRLVSTALATLHRQAGLSYPASRRAALEIERQMRRGGLPDCDCGRGFGWEVRGSRLHLARRASAQPDPILFTYTLSLPGELLVKELALRFRLVPWSAAAPEIDITPRRAVLALPRELGSSVTIRNRRPGDRIRPLGWDTSCRVKDLLINRKVKRNERYRLPLLASGPNIIWIPGITLDDRYRATPGNPAWIAEIEDLRSMDHGATPLSPPTGTPFETLRIAR